MTTDRWLDLVRRSVGGPVTEGTMFGAKGLRTGRRFFALWWHERLVAKLPPERLRASVDAGEAEQFESMAGRPMNGWAIIDPATDWAGIVDEARSHVETQQK